jgi:hypothetical protein
MRRPRTRQRPMDQPVYRRLHMAETHRPAPIQSESRAHRSGGSAALRALGPGGSAWSASPIVPRLAVGGRLRTITAQP